MKQVKKMSPMDAKTNSKVCKLNTDNFGTDDYWIITDGEFVTVCQQRNGDKSKVVISVDKKHFDKMIKWYLRPQNLK